MSLAVAFRADASRAIGTGHVMRCLTLADALASVGASCRFVCRQAPGDLIERIQRRGFDVGCLPPAGAAPPDPGGWHQTSMTNPAVSNAPYATDADQTLAALGRGVVDCLVVDHYALDARWEMKLRGACHNLCVIDDLADRPHDCDLLLDQNWFADATLRRYDSLVPAHCIKLLGPQFALLGPDYASLRGLMPRRDGLVRRVMVSLGGSDPTNETAKALEALMQPDLAALAVDVVIGANHPCPEMVAALVERRPGTILHADLPSLSGLIARSDLGIGAGGVTGWERMCLGLPSVVVSIADNQTPTTSLGWSGRQWARPRRWRQERHRCRR